MRKQPEPQVSRIYVRPEKNPTLNEGIFHEIKQLIETIPDRDERERRVNRINQVLNRYLEKLVQERNQFNSDRRLIEEAKKDQIGRLQRRIKALKKKDQDLPTIYSDTLESCEKQMNRLIAEFNECVNRREVMHKEDSLTLLVHLVEEPDVADLVDTYAPAKLSLQLELA